VSGQPVKTHLHDAKSDAALVLQTLTRWPYRSMLKAYSSALKLPFAWSTIAPFLSRLKIR
jgi:hypothetical protein